MNRDPFDHRKWNPWAKLDMSQSSGILRTTYRGSGQFHVEADNLDGIQIGTWEPAPLPDWLACETLTEVSPDYTPMWLMQELEHYRRTHGDLWLLSADPAEPDYLAITRDAATG